MVKIDTNSEVGFFLFMRRIVLMDNDCFCYVHLGMQMHRRPAIQPQQIAGAQDHPTVTAADGLGTGLTPSGLLVAPATRGLCHMNTEAEPQNVLGTCSHSLFYHQRMEGQEGMALSRTREGWILGNISSQEKW